MVRVAATKKCVYNMPIEVDERPLIELDDENLASAVAVGQVASHTLEAQLADTLRAVKVRRRAVELRSGRSLEGLGLEHYDYDPVVGACCEMVIGHVQIPVGVAGPLLLDGVEYMVPMATTEGCLVASTNRGCKAIHLAGGASSVLLKDGMTRAPVVRFETVLQGAQLKAYLENPATFALIAEEFNKSSRYSARSW